MTSHASQKHAYAWHLLMIVPMVILIVTYLWQMNNQAAYSFSIRKLESEKKQLATEIEDLLWQISDERSLVTVKERAHELSLVPPQSVEFLEIGLSSVAVASDGARRVSP